MSRRYQRKLVQFELKIQRLELREQVYKEKQNQFAETVKRLHMRIDESNKQISDLAKEGKDNNKKLYTLSGSFAITWVIIQYLMGN